METLKVCFFGPYALGEDEDENILLNAVGKEKGVYLWTVQLEDEFLTYYVGETGVSFAAGTMEHLRNYLHGQYSLPESQAFARGEERRIWEGMWKERKDNPRVMHEFLQRYLGLSSKCFDVLTFLRFFVAPVELPRRLRQRMRARIAHTLYAQLGIVGAFQDEGIRYLPRHEDEQPIRLRLEIPRPIIGLPDELII